MIAVAIHLKKYGDLTVNKPNGQYRNLYAVVASLKQRPKLYCF